MRKAKSYGLTGRPNSVPASSTTTRGATLARDGADDAEVFAAFLRTLKWRTASAADRELFQAPFRAGIRLDAYQLPPLAKALDFRASIC